MVQRIVNLPHSLDGQMKHASVTFCGRATNVPRVELEKAVAGRKTNEIEGRLL